MNRGIFMSICLGCLYNLCRNVLKGVFPVCVSTVISKTLSEPEPRVLEGLLRQGATVRKQCGSSNCASG